MRYKVLKFWDKFGKNCKVFLTGGMKGSFHPLTKNPTNQKFANSPPHQEKCPICSICIECCF